LLTDDEQKEMNVESFFDVFRTGHSFYTNEYMDHAWANAKKDYERRLVKVEE
jgi:hypothetical protein